MLITFLLLALIPLAWALAIKRLFGREVTWLESGGVFVAGVLLVGLGLFIAYKSQLHDVEILNGSVTSKYHQDVSCSHSYPCHCHSTKNGTTCDTCYMHPFDREWVVDSNVGSVNIDTVDLQGLVQPSRWTAVQLGEPFSREHWYDNYVLAAKGSLFHQRADRKLVPSYQGVYDYYRFNHVVTIGAHVPNIDVWNQKLALLLEKVGPARQANINILFVSNPSDDFGRLIESGWVGGKKNDINIVIGAANYPKIDWVYAFTFAKSAGNGLTTIAMQNRLLALGKLDNPDDVLSIVGDVVMKTFHRKSMEDFKYLAAEVAPSVGGIVVVILVLLLGCLGLTYYVVNNGVREYLPWRRGY